MAPIDLITVLRARTFGPFRLFMNDGGTFDVKHPELCLVGANSAFVGLNPTEEGMYTRFAILDLVAVSRIEPLHNPAGPAQSGAQGR